MPVVNGRWVPRSEPKPKFQPETEVESERSDEETATATVRSDEAVAEAIVNATGVDITLPAIEVDIPAEETEK